MFKTVIFDLDGTLLDTLEDIAAAANHTLSVLGFPTHSSEAYKKMVGNSVTKLIERMLPESQRKEATLALTLEMYAQYYQAHMVDLTKPYPGIVPLIADLRAAGVQLAVLSNKDDGLVCDLIQKYFPDSFDCVMGMQDGFLPKPDPASVLEVMRLTQADPAATLYCGDSDVDVHTAHNASLPCCGVSWGFRGEDELRQAGADYIAGDANALYEIILGNG